MAAAYAKSLEINDEHTKKYFTTEEWDAMPDMEKIRKTSLLRNYLVLKEFAFDPEPPDFVRRQQIKENPELANKKFVPSIPKILSGPYTMSDKKNQQHFLQYYANENVVPRYPKRQSVPPVCYNEDADAENKPEDDYFFCELCNKGMQGGTCKFHGKPLMLKNIKLPSPCDDRARRTLPFGLELRPSNIPGQGLGVFVRKGVGFPRHTLFGPYDGKIVKKVTLKTHCWKLTRTGSAQFELIFDANDDRYASWLKFVRTARFVGEATVKPSYYKGMVYYRSLRTVRQKDELLVWHEDDFNKAVALVEDHRNSCLDHPKVEGQNKDAIACQYCPLGFESLGTIQRHVHLKHGSQHAKLVLQFTATAVFPPSVYTHVESALAPSHGNPVCPICYENFHTRQELAQHLKDVHLHERRHKCNLCDYASKFKSELDRHMLTHTGEKRFECQTCGKKFTRKENLTRHLKLHSNDDSHLHKCKDCPKKFAQKGDLKNHIQAIHLKVKPFICPHCEYKCVQSTNLKTHIKSQHPDKL